MSTLTQPLSTSGEYKILEYREEGRDRCEVLLEAPTRELLDIECGNKAYTVAQEYAREKGFRPYGIIDVLGPYPVDSQGRTGVGKIVAHRLKLILSAGMHFA